MSRDLDGEGLYRLLVPQINERSHCMGCAASTMVNILCDIIVSAPNYAAGDDILVRALADLPALVAKNRAVMALDDAIGRPVGRG